MRRRVTSRCRHACYLFHFQPLLLISHTFQQSSCRSDATDTLENAEFIGVNSYLHCDGALGADDVLPGMAALLSDFASYGMTVPVMVRKQSRNILFTRPTVANFDRAVFCLLVACLKHFHPNTIIC